MLGVTVIITGCICALYYYSWVQINRLYSFPSTYWETVMLLLFVLAFACGAMTTLVL